MGVRLALPGTPMTDPTPAPTAPLTVEDVARRLWNGNGGQ